MRHDRTTHFRFAGLVGWLLLVFAAAAIGSAATSTGVDDWYLRLAKPDWTPPSWVFGPAWTVLYLMMAVAAWLVWQSDSWRATRTALVLFLAQLVLNVLWSVLFFGMQRPDLAFADIVLLWLSILATILAFWKHSLVAAWLLVPYFAWTSFAAALNWAIWRMNV